MMVRFKGGLIHVHATLFRYLFCTWKTAEFSFPFHSFELLCGGGVNIFFCKALHATWEHQTSVSGWCCIPPQLFSSITLRCEVTVMARRLCSVPRSERDEELLRPDTFLTFWRRRRVYLKRFLKPNSFWFVPFINDWVLLAKRPPSFPVSQT